MYFCYLMRFNSCYLEKYILIISLLYIQVFCHIVNFIEIKIMKKKNNIYFHLIENIQSLLLCNCYIVDKFYPQNPRNQVYFIIQIHVYVTFHIALIVKLNKNKK